MGHLRHRVLYLSGSTPGAGQRAEHLGIWVGPVRGDVAGSYLRGCQLLSRLAKTFGDHALSVKHLTVPIPCEKGRISRSIFRAGTSKYGPDQCPRGPPTATYCTDGPPQQPLLMFTSVTSGHWAIRRLKRQGLLTRLSWFGLIKPTPRTGPRARNSSSLISTTFILQLCRPSNICSCLTGQITKHLHRERPARIWSIRSDHLSRLIDVLSCLQHLED